MGLGAGSVACAISAFSSLASQAGPLGQAPGNMRFWEGMVSNCLFLVTVSISGFTKLSLTRPFPLPNKSYWVMKCWGHFLGTCNSPNRNSQWELWVNSTSICSSWGFTGGWSCWLSWAVSHWGCQGRKLRRDSSSGREAHLADSSPQTAESPLEGNVSPGRHKGGDIHLNRHC